MVHTNWMENTFDPAAGGNNRRMSAMVMPGSHDSGLYMVTRTGTMAGKTLTQFVDFTGQLDAGARFFDVRIYHHSGQGVLGHFPGKGSSGVGLGAYGPTFATCILQIEQWLTANPNEFVILKATLSKDARKQANIQTTLAPIWPGTTAHNLLWNRAGAANPYIAQLTYTQARGNLFICFEPDYAPNPAHLHGNLRSRLHVVQKCSYTEPNALGPSVNGILHLGGKAPTKARLADVMQKQRDRINPTAAHRNTASRLDMFYLTITSMKHNIVDNTAREFGLAGTRRAPADPHRSKFAAWVAVNGYQNQIQYLANWPGYTPNIVHYDFVNAAVSTDIIALN